MAEFLGACVFFSDVILMAPNAATTAGRREKLGLLIYGFGGRCLCAVLAQDSAPYVTVMLRLTRLYAGSLGLEE